MNTFLFVCTGNTCRSPMAEAIAREWLTKSDLPEANDVFVASAGVLAPDGAPVSLETLEALRAIGIEFDGASTPLSREMVQRADRVFCMSRSHLEAVRQMLGNGGADDPTDAISEKITLLDPAQDIEDPIGMCQDVYTQLAERMSILIPARLKETFKS